MLDQVNDVSWKANKNTIDEWLRRGLIGWGPTQKVMHTIGATEPWEFADESTASVKDKLEHNAQYAFACFWHMCEFSERNNVPIVVDQ